MNVHSKTNVPFFLSKQLALTWHDQVQPTTIITVSDQREVRPLDDAEQTCKIFREHMPGMGMYTIIDLAVATGCAVPPNGYRLLPLAAVTDDSDMSDTDSDDGRGEVHVD